MAHLASAGESSITDLAAPFDVTLMAISKHVHVLAEAGLVEIQREGRVHWCRVREEALRAVRDWLDHYGGVASLGNSRELRGLVSRELE